MLTKQELRPKAARKITSSTARSQGIRICGVPGEYRNSGVMTFIVNQDGVVYEKDLGADTAKVAAAMTDYNPDKTWSKVDCKSGAF